MSYSISNFIKLSDLVEKPKKQKETEKAILFEGKKDDQIVNFWVPKGVLANKGKTYYILKSFEIKFLVVENKDKGRSDQTENINDYLSNKEFYNVYKEAVKQKLNIRNIGSHLLLNIDKQSTKLKDLFVQSGGERNWSKYCDGVEEYYVFYAQYKPYFEGEKEKA